MSQGLVERSLGTFFAACGLEPQFEWGPGFWETLHVTESYFTDHEQDLIRQHKEDAENGEFDGDAGGGSRRGGRR